MWQNIYSRRACEVKTVLSTSSLSFLLSYDSLPLSAPSPLTAHHNLPFTKTQKLQKITTPLNPSYCPYDSFCYNKIFSTSTSNVMSLSSRKKPIENFMLTLRVFLMSYNRHKTFQWHRRSFSIQDIIYSRHSLMLYGSHQNRSEITGLSTT
jgi:hypothetical protein